MGAHLFEMSVQLLLDKPPKAVDALIPALSKCTYTYTRSPFDRLFTSAPALPTNIESNAGDAISYTNIIYSHPHSPFDRLFTRIGTADNIESNASSFMVEMAGERTQQPSAC